MDKYNVEFPLSYKQKLDNYDNEKKAYNLKNKDRIKEVKINKKLNTKKMTDPDNNLLAPYVSYNERKRSNIPDVRLDRIQTPRIPKKNSSSSLPSSSKK